MNSREGEGNLPERDREGGPEADLSDTKVTSPSAETRGSDESRANPIAQFLSLSRVREKIEGIGFPPGGYARARDAVRSVSVLREGVRGS